MKHKVGVVGTNNRSRRYIAHLNASNFYEAAGFTGSDLAESRSIVKDYSRLAFLPFEELMNHADTLIFSSLSNDSEKRIADSLKQGKNLILPHYHFFNLTQLQRFARIATEADSLVFCGSANFHNPALQEAGTYFTNPVFIDVARLQQFSASKGKVSILNDLLIQDLDWVLQAVSSNVKRISVNPVSVLNRNDSDFINLKLEFDNGCIANLTSSRISELNLKKARIYYDKNVLYVDLLNQELKRSFQNEDSVLFEEVSVIKEDEVKIQLQEFHLALEKKSTRFISLSKAITHFQILEQIAEKIKLKSTFLPV